jgi:CheY-like chemotaxis protein
MTTAPKSVRVLVVDDNPLVRDLMCRALDPLCEVASAADGADGLLKAVDNPPDLIIADYRMGGLDGRKLYEKLRGREATRNIPFIFVASRGDIEEKLRPLVVAEDFLPKPFFVADLVRLAKRVVDRLHLEHLQQHAARPGVISGRLEEMGVAELMQSLEMGQKTCKLSMRHNGEACELYFAAGACKDARMGNVEGDEVVFRAVNWMDGEFEIEFGVLSDRTSTTRSTTGLLMEAMRLMDEATSDSVPK